MFSLRYTCTILLTLLMVTNSSAFVFDFNANCQRAYKRYMALQHSEAVSILKQEITANPDNLIPAYLADYGDCLRLLFNGNKDEFEQWQRNYDRRLDLMYKGDENSPWYRFCRANIHFHWALVHMRFGEQFKAAIRFRKSFLLLKENMNRFPDFEENRVLFGLEEAAAGTIPDSYKWLASIFGIKGNVNRGVASISNYLRAHSNGMAPMYDEAMIYYVYLKFYLQSKPDVAWEYINAPGFLEPDNLMRSFVKANISLNYRKSEVAFNVLKDATAIKEYSSYPVMDYELAEALLYRLDYSCVNFYQRFIATYRGRHFIRDAWQKVSWVAYLQGNRKVAEFSAERIKETGTSETDADKTALKFAERKVWPNAALLEVRLLIDGGYYKMALSKIQNIPQSQLNGITERLEYNFRYGRIFEELGNTEKAFQFYKAVIDEGRTRSEYFAARSALQMGFMYERSNKKADAIAQFRECLKMRNHDFQSSIDQQAKAGLNRLEG